MKKRLREFAIRCVRLAASFPKGPVGDTVGRQLVRAGTGAAANYRAACIGRSKADFIAKLGIVEEETDEANFWVDLAPDVGLTNRRLVEGLLKEGTELFAIVVQSLKTARANETKERRRRLGSGPAV
jgi:four helix bundle protein